VERSGDIDERKLTSADELAAHQDPDSSRAAFDDVTFLSHIRGGGLDLVQWQLPHDHEPDLSEAVYVRRHTGLQAL
jgi:hypothetical protein